MNLLLDKNGKVQGYATVGSFVGGVDVDDTIVPQGFEEDFWPEKWAYDKKKDVLVLTGVPAPQPPEPEPDPRDAQIASLLQRAEEQDNALIELAEMVGGE